MMFNEVNEYKNHNNLNFLMTTKESEREYTTVVMAYKPCHYFCCVFTFRFLDDNLLISRIARINMRINFNDKQHHPLSFSELKLPEGNSNVGKIITVYDISFVSHEIGRNGFRKSNSTR